MQSKPSSTKQEQKQQQQQQQENYKYTCVTCLTPSSTLYKNYSSSTSSSSIKLTRCTNCKSNVVVDPYIEYELLLIVMDCILFRKKAYRHLLFNRSFSKEKSPFLGLFVGETGVGTGKVLQYMILASLLDCFLKYQAFLQGNNNDDANSGSRSLPMEATMIMMMQLFIVSFIEQLAMLFGTIFTSRFILHRYSSSSSSSNKKEQKSTTTNDVLNTNNKNGDVTSKIIQSLYIPFFSSNILTIFIVSVWENTDIVRILGSLYMVAMRFINIQTVLERSLFWKSLEDRSRKKDEEGRSRIIQHVHQSIIIPALPLFVGMVLRCMVQPLFFMVSHHMMNLSLSSMSSLSTGLVQQCPGLNMRHIILLFGIRGEDYGSDSGSTVCLT